MTTAVEEPKRRWWPRWRKMTWAIVIFSGLMLTWAVGGAGANDCADQVGAYQNAKQAGCEAGTAIGVGLIFGLWFMGFVVLSIVWFMSRPKEA